MDTLTYSEPVATTATLRLLRGLAGLAHRIRDLGRPEHTVCPNCLRAWPSAEWQGRCPAPGCRWAHGYSQSQATQPN